MRLDTLTIRRLPGIEEGFTLSGTGPGINVIIGPNASGKSSLIRALRALLYRDEQRGQPVDLEAVFGDEASEERWRALRIGDDLHWQRAGERVDPPPLPEHRFVDCYTLHVEDLLDASAATDSEIASRLARELAGGYDLRALRTTAPLHLRPRHGYNEAEALRSSRQALRQLQQQQQQLQRDANQLATLRADKESADEAGREAQQHERALELLAAVREVRSLAARHATYPAEMERLRDDELDTLTELREQHRSLVQQLEQVRERRERATETLQQCGFESSDLDAHRLEDQRKNLRHLQQCEQQLATQCAERTAARSRRNEAAELLGGTPEQVPTLDPATLHEVEQRLDAKRELEAAIHRAEAEWRQLPAADAERPAPEPLRRARAALLDWRGAARAAAWTPRRLAAAAAVLLPAFTGLVAAGVYLHGSLLALLLPLVLGAYWLAGPGSGSAERAAARRRFTETGLAPPTAWHADAVDQRLQALDAELAAAEEAKRQQRRRAEVERELEVLRRDLAAAREQLGTDAQRLGYDPEQLDASFQRWLRLVADWDQAQRDVAQVQAQVERLQGEAEERRRGALALLAQFDEAPTSASPDAETLFARLDHLGQRLRAHEGAQGEIAEAERERVRLEREREALEGRIAARFTRLDLDPGDDATLRQWAEWLPSWRSLCSELEAARVRENDRRETLRGRDDLLARVDADDEDTLQGRLERYREQAGSHEALIREIERIENAIAAAGHERKLENGRARYQQAVEALRERLDEALFAEAGRCLLDEIEAEYEHTVQPPALRRASDWLGRFTHHQYALELIGEERSRFAARETASDERRALNELSSGTRMQLLLAVRVGFALTAEQDRSRLPLFLDEALTTADPERFSAAADALTVLAHDEGRQVFYLTSQPEDVAYWQCHAPDCHTLDLAALRGQQRGVETPAALALAPLRSPPAPGSQTPEAYALTLGVPPVDPWAPVTAIHCFHLLRDDLVLLHRLLAASIERLGPLQSILDSPHVTTLLDAAEITRLRARTAGATAFIEAWRHGRGHPVDRSVLDAAPAVSARFLDAVAAEADAAGGNGERLIAALANNAVRNFRDKKRVELEEWLSEHGYIDPRAPLTPAEIELRVAGAMAAYLSERETLLHETRELIRSLTPAPDPHHPT